jgi:hypothetical protein
MNFSDYIKPELLVLVPVLYFIGIAIKKSSVSDKFIPWILGGVSVALSAIWIFANCECHSTADVLTAIFTALTQGVLIAGASVYANQLYKQTGKDE